MLAAWLLLWRARRLARCCAAMVANAAVDPLTGKADCAGTVELIVLAAELIPEILVLSALRVLLAAAVAEDSVVCAEGMLCCCWEILLLWQCCSSWVCALLIMDGVLLHGGWEDGACILTGMDTGVPADRAGSRKNSTHSWHHSLNDWSMTQAQKCSPCRFTIWQYKRNMTIILLAFNRCSSQDALTARLCLRRRLPVLLMDSYFWGWYEVVVDWADGRTADVLPLMN